jgi:diguanylate cyclase (GGDEF)-like protein
LPVLKPVVNLRRRALDRLIHMPPASAGGYAILMTLSIAFADYATGHQDHFSAFYMLPVMLATWGVGRFAGYMMGFGCAIIWQATNALAGQVFVAPWEPVWNAGTRIVFFLVAATLAFEMRRRLTEEMHLARIDPLTGALNRRAFFEVLNSTVSTRESPVLGIVYLDIDDFKRVNDLYGHDAGDEVLTILANGAMSAQRRGDLVGRIGGDEFLLLVRGQTVDGVEAGIRRFCEVIRAALASTPARPSFSAGAAILPADAHANAARLIAEADTLMLHVKAAGKGHLLIERLGIDRAPDPLDRRVA